uniref:uncharacterized protein LOC122600453 n=1 Tax=Erigeron canadensis TaxID=72917 RepID=UPI001CB9B2EB|nr:uncharacterized protein LOC122600453 [Erigeron canadensis]XP_043629112.1 uncharacterized protein LOC122600453 [Erigeron canadensis]
MKEEVLVSVKESTVTKIEKREEEEEDMLVDVVDDDLNNGVVEEESGLVDRVVKDVDLVDKVVVLETVEEVVVEESVVSIVGSESGDDDKSGNGTVVAEESKMDIETSGGEVVGKEDKEVIGLVQKVDKKGKEVATAKHGLLEGQVEAVEVGLVGVEKVEDGTEERSLLTKNEDKGDEVEQTTKESLQSIVEVNINDENKSESGLNEEKVGRGRPIESVDVDGVTNEKSGNTKALGSTKILESVAKVDEVVAGDGFSGKDEIQGGVSVDQSTNFPEISTLSSDVVNSGTGEGAVHGNARNLVEKADIGAISKEESSLSMKEGKTDSKIDDEPQVIEGEIAVIDEVKEPEIGLASETIEQPTGAVHELADADHVMDETIENKEEVSGSSKVPEPLTVANLGSEEDDVIVVEEGLEGKGEGLEVVKTADVGATSKDESLHATVEVSMTEKSGSDVGAHNGPDAVAVCSEVIEVTGAEKRPNAAAQNIGDTSISQVVSGSNDVPSNGGKEAAKQHVAVLDSAVEVPPTGGPQMSVEDSGKANNAAAHVEHGVLSADTQFSYEGAHMERGDEAGMDIDEVLSWKDEIPSIQEVEQKVDLANVSSIDEQVDVDVEEHETEATEPTLEAKQWNQTSVSLHQSGYFHPPENEGEFSVSDLVWGKVRSHPWWPGQIFDSSDASEQAMKYHKKDCFLVAYFGDRTFAWNESTVLKPFRPNFSEIVGHTNLEAFNNAVHCALEEVSRRVELGLTCSCIPRDIYDNIKCQIVENSGIKQESSKRQDIDKSASVNSFEPDKLVDYVRLVAKVPYGEVDKMELTMAKAQLSSYGRFKGYRQLAEFQSCGDLLELDQVLQDATYSDDGSKKRKALDSLSDGSEKRPSHHAEPVPAAKPSFQVGACIQRVASQLTGPPTKVEPSDQAVVSTVSDQAEMLSQLHLAAQDPQKGYNFLNNIIPFFNGHRATVLSKSKQISNDVRKRKTSNENDPEEFEFDDVNDSYWTDRIIQNYSDEQLLPENQNGGGAHQIAVAYEQEKPVKQTRRSNKKRFFNSNHEIEAKEQLELIERRRLNLATEVSMKFTEGVYFPSEIHLNKMFRRFGPLMESETEVDRQSGRARVVFKKCSDAEVAHGSAEKFNIFGSIAVRYDLNYTPLISYKPLPLPVAQDVADAC